MRKHGLCGCLLPFVAELPSGRCQALLKQQRRLEVTDEDGTVLGDYFADLFVEDCLIIELKACKALAPEHTAQALGYLRAANQRHALLINFGAPRYEVKKLIL